MYTIFRHDICHKYIFDGRKKIRLMTAVADPSETLTKGVWAQGVDPYVQLASRVEAVLGAERSGNVLCTNLGAYAGIRIMRTPVETLSEQLHKLYTSERGLRPLTNLPSFDVSPSGLRNDISSTPYRKLFIATRLEEHDKDKPLSGVGSLVGAALVTYNDKTGTSPHVEISDVIVAEPYRRNGIGTSLVLEAADSFAKPGMTGDNIVLAGADMIPAFTRRAELALLGRGFRLQRYGSMARIHQVAQQ